MILIIFSSCVKTNQQKAEALVKFYLDKTLSDSTTFKIIDFSKLDTLGMLYVNDSQWSKYYHRWMWEKDDERVDSVNNYKLYKSRKAGNFYKNELSRDSLKADSIKSTYDRHNYKAKIQELKITCKYQARLKTGVFVLRQVQFLLDSDLTSAKPYTDIVVQ